MAKTRNEITEAKKFGAVLGIALGLIAGYLAWKEKGASALLSAALSGLSFLLPVILFPVWLKFFRLWMKFAEGLSWIMTRVILGAFFFLVLTPTTLALRLVGKRPLDLRFKDGKRSYWIDKPKGEATVERYRKQY